MKLISSKNIFANVADCKYNNFGKFRVPIPVLPQEQGLIHKLSCKKIILPYNWLRVISGLNDTITLVINSITTTITITSGNPNIVDLITFINNYQTKVLATFNRMNSKIEWNNQCSEQATITLSTTAIELLGITSSLTIPYLATETSQSIVDVRPAPIVQIKITSGTNNEEVFNSGSLKNSGVLLTIGMDTPLYGINIYEDAEGDYETEITKEMREISVRITDVNDNILIPQTSPYFTFCIQSYRDTDEESMSIQKEQLQLKKMGMILKHTGSSK